jgi:hypothetical protein
VASGVGVVFEKVAKLPQAKTNPQIKPALPKSNPVMMGAYAFTCTEFSAVVPMRPH